MKLGPNKFNIHVRNVNERVSLFLLSETSKRKPSKRLSMMSIETSIWLTTLSIHRSNPNVVCEVQDNCPGRIISIKFVSHLFC